jgi:hypothetical protein
MVWRFEESAMSFTKRRSRATGWVACAVSAGVIAISGVGVILASAPAFAEEASAQTAKPPAVPPEGAPAARVIFTGFVRRVDRSASIFVRLTGEVPVAVERTGRRLVYHLAGAKLGVANNGNPLPTEHFGPPVSHVALVPGSDGVDLVIDLSQEPDDAGPTHRLVPQGGLATLHVDLPPAAK